MHIYIYIFRREWSSFSNRCCCWFWRAIPIHLLQLHKQNRRLETCIKSSSPLIFHLFIYSREKEKEVLLLWRRKVKQPMLVCEEFQSIWPIFYHVQSLFVVGTLPFWAFNLLCNFLVGVLPFSAYLEGEGGGGGDGGVDGFCLFF